ncbi:uncharacterized protein DUF190 [Chromohalobacter marismortui]|uniref:Uncharacterized protein DUF190 n=1 Tax=Chromohalobacter marismortui TaxID=42055 RepID=A0A4R7NJC0_9GAMM|nr:MULTISPECIES: DUF190 domain-containing protein [Chromohalobacter]MCI0511558.1 DUF190 domain-containing protein [Chromohalobacter sp.]MCI0594483.1 DUF190 domain-containing protein [Chromohalobacter sp.]TDU20499.1 uncharacterized protein DUF190 [Chromohalobacter marismortui]
MNAWQQGDEVTFMAPQSRRHHGKPVIDAVAECAKGLGITRMTQRTDSEGTGANGRTHSAHFFELADQPVELAFVLEKTLADRLIEEVDRAGIDVFVLRRDVSYAQLGDERR